MIFDKELNIALITNLKLKAKIIVALTGFVLVIQIVGFTFTYYNSVWNEIPFNKLYLLFPLTFLVVFLSELYSVRYFNRLLKTNNEISNLFAYFITIIEISLPSFLFLITGGLMNDSPVKITVGELLNFPQSSLYFLVIILSALMLDFKVSFLAGLIAAIEFILIIFYFYSNDTSNADTEFGNIFINVIKALLMLLCGVVAGLVSKKIKEALMSSLESKHDLINKLDLLVKEKTSEVVLQNEKIEQKNKDLTDSIEYALRIQTAILPPHKIVRQYLENSFILYKPKDIVAGDFYWMETKDNLVLFAACDCTGHGVPGAMVSVVCHNALNRAVKEFGLTEPATILDKTAEIVIENFSKSEEDIKDGMDISLCSYNAKTKTIQWAGANNPLWLLQNGELIETKADKQPIGMNEDSKLFTNHTFTLNHGDTIYLFTDGFADQFGGDTGQKKLTKKRFKELILSIQDKTMQEQGIALDKFITEYRKSIEQIDDILVMGVKI